MGSGAADARRVGGLATVRLSARHPLPFVASLRITRGGKGVFVMSDTPAGGRQPGAAAPGFLQGDVRNVKHACQANPLALPVVWSRDVTRVDVAVGSTAGCPCFRVRACRACAHSTWLNGRIAFHRYVVASQNSGNGDDDQQPATEHAGAGVRHTSPLGAVWRFRVCAPVRHVPTGH